MRVIYSFWTKPYRDLNILGGHSNGWQGGVDGTDDKLQIAIQRASKYYEISAKCFKKLGYKIEIFTDKIGESLINQKLYDNVSIDLEDIKDESSELWSLAKIFSIEKALSRSDDACIHVDHDIFFNKPDFIKKQIDSEWEILVQSKEIDDHYYDIYDKSISIFCNIFGVHPLTEKFLKTYNYVYNCGFLGFKNKEQAELYLPSYYKLYKYIANQRLNLNKYVGLRAYCNASDFGLKANINCIIEQVLLTAIANLYNIHTKEVFPISSWGGRPSKTIIKYNPELGFFHASGNAKYTSDKMYQKILTEFDL